MTSNKWNPWNWFKNEENAMRGNMPAAMRRGSGLAALPGMGAYRVPSLQPLSDFYRDMDRVFENAFRSFGFGDMQEAFGLPQMMGRGGMFVPHVDIASTNQKYTVSVEVPGMNEKDIKLDLLADGTLIISGEKKLEEEGNERDYHTVERSYGFFQRVLSLPSDAELDSIEANFKNGVLKIDIFRMESADADMRHIPINTSAPQREQRGAVGANINAPGHKKAA